jgi:hypothetical protein
MANIHEVVSDWPAVLHKLADYKARVEVLEAAPAPAPSPSTTLTITSTGLGVLSIYATSNEAETTPGPLGYETISFPNLVCIVENGYFSQITDVVTLDMPVWEGGIGAATPFMSWDTLASLKTLNMPKVNLGKLGSGSLEFTNCPKLENVDVSEMVWVAGGTLSFQYCKLTVATVNAILVRAATFLPGITDGQIRLNLGTQAAPTGAGSDAKAALILAGWSVQTN